MIFHVVHKFKLFVDFGSGPKLHFPAILLVLIVVYDLLEKGLWAILILPSGWRD